MKDKLKNIPVKESIEKTLKACTSVKDSIQNILYSHATRLKKWAAIEKDLSPEERKTEYNFFISTLIIGSILFVSASSARYIEYQDNEFWPTTEISFESNHGILLAEDGYFGKTSVPTIGDSDRSEVANVTRYEVQAGETIDIIASKFGITQKTIIENNSIKNPEALETGQTLTILPVDGYLYDIKRGDTLSVIAQHYKIEEEILKKQNNLDARGLISGQSLILPGASKPTPIPTRVPVIAVTPTRTQNTTTTTRTTNTQVAQTPTKVEYVAPRSGKKYSWPVVGRGTLTSGYRYGHYAIDIWGANQPGIKAISSGTVTQAVYHCAPRSYGCTGGYGNVVVIDHGNGVQARYAHNAAVYVSVGEYVSAGQVIAQMGNSGNTYGRTGIHLHFELIMNGRKVNPLNYL